MPCPAGLFLPSGVFLELHPAAALVSPAPVLLAWMSVTISPFDHFPMPRLRAWREKLDELLTANEAKPSRERLTLIRVFEALRGFGYEGGYDVVRRYARGTPIEDAAGMVTRPRRCRISHELSELVGKLAVSYFNFCNTDRHPQFAPDLIQCGPPRAAYRREPRRQLLYLGLIRLLRVSHSLQPGCHEATFVWTLIRSTCCARSPVLQT
jgi:hypothetical protein